LQLFVLILQAVGFGQAVGVEPPIQFDDAARLDGHCKAQSSVGILALVGGEVIETGSPRQASWKGLGVCTNRNANFRERLFLDVRYIKIAVGSLCRGQDLPAHAPSRDACTRYGACPAAHPHRVRSAKSAGNTGMASGSGSRTNRGRANPNRPAKEPKMAGGRSGREQNGAH
jgi:hypothetical protein